LLAGLFGKDVQECLKKIRAEGYFTQIISKVLTGHVNGSFNATV
jgi:hypothetical protein